MGKEDDLLETNKPSKEEIKEQKAQEKQAKKEQKAQEKEAKKQQKNASGKPKKKKHIGLIIFLVILVILGFLVWRVISNLGAAVETVSNMVQVEPVQTRDLSDSISLSGTVSGASRTNVVSEATAEVLTVDVQVGDLVAAGDSLVTLDTEEIERQIATTQKSISNSNALSNNESSQASVSLAQATEDQATALAKAQETIDEAQKALDEANQGVADCKEALAFAKKDMDKAAQVVTTAQAALDADPTNATLQADLAAAQEAYAMAQANVSSFEGKMVSYKDGVESAQKGLDSANTSYTDTVTSTNRTVAAAQNTVNMEQYQNSGTTDLKTTLENLKKQLSDCAITAPSGGVVTAVNVSVGDNYVANTVMITIEDTSALKIVATVGEADILKLTEGMPATITTTATGEETMTGTITRVVRVKNQSTGATADAATAATAANYSAEVSVDSTELLVGMNAKVRIVLKDKTGVLAVPYDLIQTDENGDSFVLVAVSNEDGTATAVRKNVTVGEEIDYYTEITGGDLKEGDMLIYDNSGTVAEGQIFAPQQMYSEQDLSSGTDGSGLQVYTTDQSGVSVTVEE